MPKTTKENIECLKSSYLLEVHHRFPNPLCSPEASHFFLQKKEYKAPFFLVLVTKKETDLNPVTRMDKCECHVRQNINIKPLGQRTKVRDSLCSKRWVGLTSYLEGRSRVIME